MRAETLQMSPCLQHDVCAHIRNACHAVSCTVASRGSFVQLPKRPYAFFFFVCRLPPFGKTISVPRHQKQLQLLAFFFSPFSFFFVIFVTSAVLHRSRFFFFRARHSTQLSLLNIYIYFCKVLKAQKSCMNFFACPSIAVFF